MHDEKKHFLLIFSNNTIQILNLFSFNPSLTFEQRYTTLAFINRLQTKLRNNNFYLQAPKGKRVQFQFRNSFKISCRRNCRDYVEVRYKKLSDAGPRYLSFFTNI